MPSSKHEVRDNGAESTDPRADMRVALHGPAVTIEDAIRAGEATKDLLHAVAQQLGAPADAVGWRIKSVQFICDGCGLLRPDRPGPDEGWTHRDGDDLCPTCSEGAK